MHTLEKRIEEIIEKWYEDNEGFCREKTELKNKLDNWLQVVTDEEAAILLELFAHSTYFSKRKINTLFCNNYEDMQNKGYSIFTAIESQDIRQNSSHIYLNEFAMVANVSEYSIIPMLTALKKEDWVYINQIVFLDDIIGTGKTVIDYFDTVKKLFEGKKILLWVVCITQSAKEKIEQYAKENDISLEILAYKIEKKAFESGYIFDLEEADRNKLIITKLEKRMWGRNTKYILGKDESQCLLSFYNDTPNNTLSSFWHGEEPWHPIFERKIKQRPAWLKEKKRERVNKNYERHEQG